MFEKCKEKLFKLLAFIYLLQDSIHLEKNSLFELTETEVKVIEKYITIQKYRYADQFSFRCVFDPELKDTYIPKNILQPLIENAIIHGICPLERPGHIELNMKREDHSIRILIMDDGAGMEQKKAELDSLQQMEGESIEAFNLRKLEVQNAYLESKKGLSDKEIEIEQAKYEAMEQVTNGLVALTEQIGESDRGFAMASKMLALAEIAINSGKAIAKMVSAESGKGILGIATMASGIATILSNIANAVKIVKSAKFAEGGLVTGPGTGTSDSIPAQLSNGESVITAKATSMFAPILSSSNMMGGGVPINVTATNNQTLGEDMLARAVAKGMMMAPAPVVSVEEFTSVANRIKYIEESGSL